MTLTYIGLEILIQIGIEFAFFPGYSEKIPGIYGLAVTIPTIAVTARRLHDLDKSGWWWLLNLVPVIGGIVLLVWIVKSGTEGPNRFGEDPRQEGANRSDNLQDSNPEPSEL